MSKRQPKRRAIFLDRDGVINHPPIRRYIHTWEEFRFLPGWSIFENPFFSSFERCCHNPFTAGIRDSRGRNNFGWRPDC